MYSQSRNGTNTYQVQSIHRGNRRVALDIEEARIQAEKRAEIINRARDLQFKEVRPIGV